MPTPTMETLATRSSWTIARAPISRRTSDSAASAPGVPAPAAAADGNLGAPLVVDDPAGADLAAHVRQLGDRPGVVAARQREGHVGGAGLADGLDETGADGC